jgi:ABC-type nitrate/sulfonate/bicarbonate transport system substrate-binding protein
MTPCVHTTTKTASVRHDHSICRLCGLYPRNQVSRLAVLPQTPVKTHNQLLKKNLDAVRRVAAANLEIHEYAANHPDEVARWYAANLPQSLPYGDLSDDLGSFTYHNHPIGDALVEQIRLSLDDLKLVKIIDDDTDTAALSKRISVNVLA